MIEEKRGKRGPEGKIKGKKKRGEKDRRGGSVEGKMREGGGRRER